MHTVDVIKHIETGRKYVIRAGDPLPNKTAYTYVRQNISQDEAALLVPNSKLTTKAKC